MVFTPLHTGYLTSRRVYRGSLETRRKAPCDSRALLETTSPKLLWNSVSVRFAEHLRTYKMHQEVFDRPFNFSAFYKTFPPGVLKPDRKFLEWFVGFSEGDGSFIVTGDRCIFTITQRDEPLLQLIQQTLGFGSIYPVRSSPGKFHYYVSSLKKDIFPLIQLFNGNLLLKKTNERFKSWVANYNRRRGTELLVISRWDGTFKPVEHASQSDSAFQAVSLKRTSVVWNSSWLAGFVDAEGSFFVELRKLDAVRLKIGGNPRFLINQKGEAELLLHLAFLISRGCFSSVVREKPDTTLENVIYQFRASSRISLKLIQDYFDSHPLRGKKALSYSKWCQVILELEKVKVLSDLASPKVQAFLASPKALIPEKTCFHQEEHKKLVALVKDINPSESKT